MLEDVAEMFKFKVQSSIMSIVCGIIPIGVKSRGLGLRRSFRLVFIRLDEARGKGLPLP